MSLQVVSILQAACGEVSTVAPPHFMNRQQSVVAFAPPSDILKSIFLFKAGLLRESRGSVLKLGRKQSRTCRNIKPTKD
jgi:hypothetical protein